MTERTIKTVISALDEYNSKSDDEIYNEVKPIIDSWKHNGLRYFAESANITKHTIYQISKPSVNHRPSFETYIRIINIGKNAYYHE